MPDVFEVNLVGDSSAKAITDYLGQRRLNYSS